MTVKDKSSSLIRKLGKICYRSIGVVLLLLAIVTFLLSLPAVQTRLARYATDELNETYGTDIRIDRLRLSPLSLNTSLKGVYVEDHQGDTLVYIRKLTTSILNARNMARGKMEFGDIDFDGLFLNMKTYEGEVDTNLDVFVDKLDDGEPREPGTPPFQLTSSEILVLNGRYRLTDENDEEPGILDFTDLSVLARDFTILGPEVTLSIDRMALESQWGLRIEDLVTDFKYTKKQMRFDSLAIKTPGSEVRGDLTFNYRREELSEFLDKVNIDGRFEDSRIAMDEINVFYDEFGKDRRVEFNTEVKGTLNDLFVEDILLRTGITGLRGDFRLRNLFDDQVPFVMNGRMDNLTTSYGQLGALMPNLLGEVIPSSFAKFGRFTVRGDAEVTETSLDIQTNMDTDLGQLYTDLQMTNIDNIDDASYRGFVSMIDFDLGDFVDNPAIGKTSMDVNVEGKGFIPEYLDTQADGAVEYLGFNGYDYRDIIVSGKFQDKRFKGSLNCTDENARFGFSGLADFSADRSVFDFDLIVEHADFKRMNFVNDSISDFQGIVKMDVSGNSIDNILGQVTFTDTFYTNQEGDYEFTDFFVSSTFLEDGQRMIKITSPDIITGYMRGNFKIAEIDRLFRNSIGSVYTNYKPFEVTSNQRLDFDFRVYNKIVEVFYPDISLESGTRLKGKIDADGQDFKLAFESPGITVFDNRFEGIEVKMDNLNPLFKTYIAVDDMETVYYDVQKFRMINTSVVDTLFFRTEFKGGDLYDDAYNLNFYHTFNDRNESVIGLKRSDLSFKGNTWLINKDENARNKIVVSKGLDSIRVDDIVMDNEVAEQIRVNGQLADSTYKNLDVNFKIVSLRKVTPVIDSLMIDGTVNGYLKILQQKGRYTPSSSLDITDFTVNDIPLGNLSVTIFGNEDLTEFGVDCELSSGTDPQFSLNGTVYNNEQRTDLDLVAVFDQFRLEPFSPLGEDVISNIRGYVDGSATISGSAEDPLINGDLLLNEAGIGIPYLNLDYSLGDVSRVDLTGRTFYFDQVSLTDTKMGTEALLDGGIRHQGFSDWNLDLDVVTRDDRLLILDTGFTEEALYYGTAFVNGSGRIFGPTSALNITFEGSTAEGTSLKIPLSDLTSEGDYSFINFIDRKFDGPESGPRILDEYQGLEMDFDLVVTPEAEVEIVVDPVSGSSLKGTGEGLLLMEINTNGKFNMYGDFAVVTGEYNFRYGGFIDKKFSVRPGGYLTWDGDPLDAQLNMEAAYPLNANPAPLLEDSSFTGRIPTEVVVRLDGALERPNIDFNIEFPSAGSVIRSELEYRLQDPTVEQRNAFFLLAQGTFVNDRTGLDQQVLTGNLIQSGFGWLNQVLGDEDDKLNLGILYEQGQLDPNADIRTENRIGVTVSTQISDRILVNGRVGVPVGGVSQSVVAGDVEVQLLLNEEGTLRTKIFNRQNEIQQFLSEQQGYTQGVGLSYQVDFDTFRQLMQRLFRKKEGEDAQDPVEEPLSLPSGDAQVRRKDSLVRFIPRKGG